MGCAYPASLSSDRGLKMILEKETYEKFGYYPGDLKPHTKKRIVVKCDDCGRIRDLRKEAYRPFCRSCAQKKVNRSREGKNNSMFGKHHSAAAKEKMRNKIKGKFKGTKHPMFGKHHTEEAKSKMRAVRKKQKFPTHHTRPELIFEEICERNNLDFHYVGDGQLWIGKKGKKQLNPDFIEANGKKICVEIMGAWWHSRLLNQKVREDALLPFREKHYKKFKWIPIFIWDTDLLREDAEQFVLNLLKDYEN